MKITENKIRQIIREEAHRALRESSFPGEAPPEGPRRSGHARSEQALRDYLASLVGGGFKRRDEAEVIIWIIRDLCDEWTEGNSEIVFEPAVYVWQKLQDEYDDYGMLSMIEEDVETFDRLVNAFVKDTCGEAVLQRSRSVFGTRRR
jgi:hypothetical protein